MNRKDITTKLKQQAAENPLAALVAGTALVSTITQLINARSASKGRRAYAKQVNYRIKNGL